MIKVKDLYVRSRQNFKNTFYHGHIVTVITAALYPMIDKAMKSLRD